MPNCPRYQLENDNQMTDLKSETRKVIKQLEDQVATLKKENNNLATELYKVSEKDDKMAELKSEMSTIIKHLEGQVANLRRKIATWQQNFASYNIRTVR